MEAKQALTADINDIIFERRNKEYGAYRLRKEYSRHLLIGAIISISIVVLALLTPKIINYFFPPEEIPVVDFVPVKTTKLAAPPRMNQTKPPPPPPDIPPPAPKTIKFEIPKVEENVVEKKDQVQKLEELKDVNIGNETVEGPKELDPGPPVIVEPPKPKETKPLDFFEEQPTLPGGYDEFLKKNIRYPEYARSNNIQGTVYLQLVIDEDGYVKDIKLLKGVETSLNEEAMRVARKFPKWNPGRNSGQPVPVRMNIPIKFVLE